MCSRMKHPIRVLKYIRERKMKRGNEKEREIFVKFLSNVCQIFVKLLANFCLPQEANGLSHTK